MVRYRGAQAVVEEVRGLWDGVLAAHARTIPERVVRRTLTEMCIILDRHCRAAISEGRMTEEQYTALRQRTNEIWTDIRTEEHR
jgi:hypothetical protein